ncbi:MAG: SCP2 sterol-binding domain-containing protein [Pseudohongiellaceae bacterium]
MSLLSSTLLAPVESLVNTALAADPASRHRLSRLGAGRILQIHSDGLKNGVASGDLYLRTGDDRLYLQGSHDGPVDARLSGSAQALAALLTASEPRQALYNPELTLTGSTDLAEGVQRLFRDLDIDWEDRLTPLLGNVAAHQLGQWLRSAGRQTRETGNRLETILKDYLNEEADWVTGRAEFNAFRADVDALRLRLDRLQARARELAGRTARNEDATK